MAERKPKWPESGNLVAATLETEAAYGNYANLDKHNYRSQSEISSSRIRQF